MIESVPCINPAMYSFTVAGTSRPIAGPLRLLLEINPLPFATNNFLPSGVTRTLVGYQPTGMNPSDVLLPGLLTSNTATVLMFAFATKRCFSSGERAREFGVLPGGEFGSNSATSVSTELPVSVFSTDTELRFALATNRYLPDLLNSISFGCSSVAHCATSLRLVKSITPTRACAQKLT